MLILYIPYDNWYHLEIYDCYFIIVRLVFCY